MSRSMKKSPQLTFLLDENVDVRIASFLTKLGFSTTICPPSIKNGEVIKLAKKESRILLTNDKDFLNTDLYYPSQTAGIIVFRIHPPSLSNLTSALGKILDNVKPEEFSGKLYIVRQDAVEIMG